MVALEYHRERRPGPDPLAAASDALERAGLQTRRRTSSCRAAAYGHGVGMEERVATERARRPRHAACRAPRSSTGAPAGAGYVASTLLALLGIALVTRYLGVADFGRFPDRPLADHRGRDHYRRRHGHARPAGVRAACRRRPRASMEALLGLRLALTVLGVAIAAGIAVAVGYDSDLVAGTVLAGIGLALTVVQTTLTIPLAAEMRNVAFTAIDLVRQALTVTGYVILVLLGAGVVAFLGVTVPVGIVMVAPRCRARSRADPATARCTSRGLGRLARAALGVRHGDSRRDDLSLHGSDPHGGHHQRARHRPVLRVVQGLHGRAR